VGANAAPAADWISLEEEEDFSARWRELQKSRPGLELRAPEEGAPAAATIPTFRRLDDTDEEFDDEENFVAQFSQQTEVRYEGPRPLAVEEARKRRHT